jgi:hypothetical protein
MRHDANTVERMRVVKRKRPRTLSWFYLIFNRNNDTTARNNKKDDVGRLLEFRSKTAIVVHVIFQWLRIHSLSL